MHARRCSALRGMRSRWSHGVVSHLLRPLSTSFFEFPPQFVSFISFLSFELKNSSWGAPGELPVRRFPSCIDTRQTLLLEWGRATGPSAAAAKPNSAFLIYLNRTLYLFPKKRSLGGLEAPVSAARPPLGPPVTLCAERRHPLCKHFNSTLPRTPRLFIYIYYLDFPSLIKLKPRGPPGDPQLPHLFAASLAARSVGRSQQRSKLLLLLAAAAFRKLKTPKGAES